MTFGSLTYHLVRGAKADDKNGLVAILGFNHDGAGYRALCVSEDLSGSAFGSQDIKAHPALSTARSLPDRVTAGLSLVSASFVAQHCNHGGLKKCRWSCSSSRLLFEVRRPGIFLPPPRWGEMVLATSKKAKDRELPLGAYPS